MNGSTLDASVLLSIFRFSRAGQRVDVLTLAEHLGATAYAVLAAAQRLEQRGCLDAHRLRLTFRGLATATSLAQSATPPLDVGHSAPVQRAEPSVPSATPPEECAAFFNQAASKSAERDGAAPSSKRGRVA